MKRVIVTGAGGFIGKHTIELLVARGYEVHAVCRNRVPESNIGVFWHQIDLQNVSEIMDLIKSVRATHLLHLSWYTKPGEYWTSIENYNWVQTSLQLFRSFYEYGGSRVVAAGSCMEYDWGKGGYFTEESPPSYSAPYAACKNHLRGLLESYSNQTGLSSAWGRIFFLYGPNEKQGRLVSSVINSLLLGQDALCSHGNQIRDFLYVEDVANAFACLLDSDVLGTVNISSGQPIRLKEIILEVARELDADRFVKLGAISVQSNESPIVVGNNTRLLNEVGWRPQYDLQEGLQKTIQWWKARLFGEEV